MFSELITCSHIAKFLELILQFSLYILVRNLNTVQTRRAAATKVSVWSGITLGVINHNSDGRGRGHQVRSGVKLSMPFL